MSPERKLPRGRGLTRGECLELVPELERPDLTGGVLYYDARLYSAERVVLAVLRGAVEAGAIVANYLGFVEPSFAQGRLAGARVEDTASGESIDVAARVIVNAAGAAAPSVMCSLTGRKGTAESAYSVALNIMLPSLGHRVSFAVRGGIRDPSAIVKVGARQLFFVPWRGTTMIGTAHYPFEGKPDEFELQDRDRERFLEQVNSAWPGEPLTRDDVRLTHGGLLPAVPGSGSEVNLLKHHRLIDHEKDGIPEAVTAVSVKFTTSRLVAEEVVDLVCRKLGRDSSKCTTMSTPLPGAPSGSVTDLIESARRRLPAGLPADVVEHLARSYGTKCEEVVECAKSVPEWDQRVVPAAPVIRAQMVYGVRREMARSSSDLVLRRTEIGPRGLVSEAAIEQAASALAIGETNLAKPRETLPRAD